MAIILTDVIVGEGLATPGQVRAAMAACGKDESRLPSALAAKGLLYGEKLEAVYEVAVCRAAEDGEGAGAAKMRLRRPPSPATALIAPPPDLAESQKDPARVFGPFTLLQEIGRGARTIVHRAWRANPGRLYAVKVFSVDRAGDEDRLRATLQAAGKLHHSRIVRVHDSGNVAGRTFLMMDLIEGRSLSERIRKGPVPWQVAATAVADGAMAMQSAHDLGVVHSDLSPANLLLDASNRAFVIGFGLAVDGEDPAQNPPLHRSPEQLEGRVRDIDGRSDVYALGCTLYHAVVGAPPFTFTGFGPFFDEVRTARPDPPSKRLPGLPPELDAVILRCLEKKPADRYGRAFDLAVDLKRVLRGLRPLTSPPAPPARRKAPEIDELTGLRSRRTLLREAETATAGPFSLVLFDMDHLRSLNDRDAADLRVRKVAGLFGDLPGSGGLAGRHGGDSFLCVLPGVDKTAAAAFAEKIRAAAPQSGVTMSAGVASAPEDGAELLPVLRAARQALAQAKKAGRDRVVSAVSREADLSSRLPSRAFAGREAEGSFAGTIFESIRRGQPGMMMVEGEPGSGKTRLLRELAFRAKTAGLFPLFITGDDAKRTVPGGALLSWIQEFYGRREASQKVLREKLTKPQRYVLRDAVPCFRTWAPEPPAPDSREYDALLSQSLDAAVRAMAGETPLVLLLDNAPAGDRLTFTVLRDLFRAGGLPLGFVAALKGPFAQIDERSADPAMLALWFESGRRGAKLLRTPPLSPDQIKTLVCSILEGTDLPDGLPERLAKASRGNPLYLEAVLRTVGARRKLATEDLPPSLEEAVRQLLEGLSPAAAELLNDAAMMSVVVDVDALQALGSWREAEVLDLLDLLEDRGLVQVGSGGSTVFSSGTLRELLLRALPAARLPEMRAKTAQVLKDLYGTSAEEPPSLVPPPAAPAPPPPPPPPAPTAPAVARPKPADLEQSARAMIELPAAKLLSLETEKALPSLFAGLIEAKLQKLMDSIVDRVGAGLGDPDIALRRAASALITRVMDQASPAAREALIRRLETPLAAAAVSESDDLTLALVGNAVRAWMATAAALQEHRLMVAFASRLAFSPEFAKRSPVVKAAVVSTLMSMDSTATLEVTDLLARGDPSLREGASRLGAMLGAPMVHPLVSLILTNGDIAIRRIAASTLKEIGDGSRQLAAQVKSDTPPNVVRNVLSIFESTDAGGGDVMAVMRVAAAHPDASVREAAGALLVRSKNLLSPLLLSELLDRPDNVLQKSAIMAAKDLKMREAGGGVLKIAETTQDEEILRAACNYFRECPMVEAVPLLSKLFSSKARAFGLLKGMSDLTRVAATEALRRLNHPDAKRMIDLAASDGSETVRRAAKPPSGGL